MLALVIVEMVFQTLVLLNQLGQLAHGQSAFDQAMHLLAEFCQNLIQRHDAFTHAAAAHTTAKSPWNGSMREGIAASGAARLSMEPEAGAGHDR